MAYYYIIFNCLFLSLLSSHAVEADISNTVNIESEELLKVFNEHLGLKIEDLEVGISSEIRANDSPLRNLVFLIGDDNTDSIEQLSESYRGDIEEFKKTGIPRVSYSDNYYVYNKKSGLKVIEIAFNPIGGWGYNQGTGMAFESYMLVGHFHADVEQTMRFTKRKTKTFYENVYEKSYATKAGEAPFSKMNKDLYSYSYVIKPNSLSREENVAFGAGVSYFEKYAKSLKVVHFLNTQTQIVDKDELQTIYENEAVNIHKVTVALTKMLSDRAEKKGVYPDEKSQKSLSSQRKIFFEDGVDNYIASVVESRAREENALEQKNEREVNEKKDQGRETLESDFREKPKPSSKGDEVQSPTDESSFFAWIIVGVMLLIILGLLFKKYMRSSNLES
jgi:hypothetical protein